MVVCTPPESRYAGGAASDRAATAGRGTNGRWLVCWGQGPCRAPSVVDRYGDPPQGGMRAPPAPQLCCPGISGRGRPLASDAPGRVAWQPKYAEARGQCGARSGCGSTPRRALRPPEDMSQHTKVGTGSTAPPEASRRAPVIPAGKPQRRRPAAGLRHAAARSRDAGLVTCEGGTPGPPTHQENEVPLRDLCAPGEECKHVRAAPGGESTEPPGSMGYNPIVDGGTTSSLNTDTAITDVLFRGIMSKRDNTIIVSQVDLPVMKIFQHEARRGRIRPAVPLVSPHHRQVHAPARRGDPPPPHPHRRRSPSAGGAARPRRPAAVGLRLRTSVGVPPPPPRLRFISGMAACGRRHERAAAATQAAASRRPLPSRTAPPRLPTGVRPSPPHSLPARGPATRERPVSFLPLVVSRHFPRRHPSPPSPRQPS